MTVDPYTTQLTGSKEAVILARAEQHILAPSNLIARTPFSKEHPELVIAFLKVYHQAVDWENEHTDEAATLLANKKKVSPDLMKERFLKKQIQITDYVNNSFINQVSGQ